MTQVYGSALTQLAGHATGYFSSGNQGPGDFKDGVYIYNSNSEGSVSMGGAATIGKGGWNNDNLINHDIKHYTEQNQLGASYLIIHGPLSIINYHTKGEYVPLERSEYHSNPEGGNYKK